MKKLGFPDSPDFLPAPTQRPARDEIRAFQAAGEAVSANNQKSELAAYDRWQAQLEREGIQKAESDSHQKGCVFAKSCNLPDGVINHNNPAGFVPLERLANYGSWAVLGTDAAITAEGLPLKWVAGSSTGNAVAQRLGGSLALSLAKGSAVVAGGAVGTVALLIPNTSLSPDSAFYKNEQYAELKMGRTRVRLNAKTLPDGSVNAYGYYTGGKKEWEFVRVIGAEKKGEKFVADIGNGIDLTWTPAANPDDVLGIPALEGAPSLPTVWVYPPTEQTNKILANPQHPPDYQDAIIWFPGTRIEPIYIALSTRHDAGVVTGVGEDVSGTWLAGAGTGLGAPIPKRIADQLRGRQFNSFDAFRKVFWTAVGNDSELCTQFIPDNVERMRSGNAPKARYRDAAGGKSSFELHHVEWISKGGDVYNVDNLRVNTPKNHIDIHRS